ncbi:MAG: hypothetical protein J6N18_13505, partial [Kiritimatiellae bacterium]|nr:hypothetical protein [Kiritimatiellia bacterium]
LIFTCGKMKIATSPLFYKGAAFFMPEKMGNLHRTEMLNCRLLEHRSIQPTTPPLPSSTIDHQTV